MTQLEINLDTGLPTLVPVTDDMLKNPSPNDWLMIRGNYKGWSHSQLNQINKQNVKGLQLAWVWAMNDLVGGHISAAFPSISLAAEHAKAGRLRLLGIASLKRADSLPEVPTISEAGVPGFEVLSWYGLLAPAGTPAEIITRLNQDVTRGLNEVDSVERIRAIGAEPMKSTPAEFGAFLKKEIAKWAGVIRTANVRAN